MITQEYAKQLFDLKNGQLVWKVQKAQRNKIGSVAGTVSKKDGYTRVIVDGKSYLAHRIVFLIENGYMPKEIDHINRDKTDNSVNNLRACDRYQNALNKNLYKNNKTKIRNVHIHSCGKYEVSFRRKNKNIYIGLFDNLELAELVAIEAASKLKAEVALLKSK